MPDRHPAPADAAPHRTPTPRGTPGGRRIASLRGVRLERRTALVAACGIAGLWLLVVFAGALADATNQASRLREARATNAALQARVDAGAVEIAAVQKRTFQDFLARAYGMGMPAERSFALAPDAPPPPSMRPLGADTVTGEPTTPLDDWLRLLFGA